MSVDFAPRHCFTVDEFHRMGEVGLFSEDDRVELIDGEIFQRTPIGSRHARCVRDLDDWLHEMMAGEALVSAQQPLRLDYDAQPIPDVVLLRPRPGRYGTSHPTAADALLVIEVADSSVLLDRNVKSRSYARAGVPEYWVVDLPTSCVAVFRGPEKDRYTEQRDYCRGESLTSVALGGREMRVDRVLDGPPEG